MIKRGSKVQKDDVLVIGFRDTIKFKSKNMKTNLTYIETLTFKENVINEYIAYKYPNKDGDNLE